MILTLGAMCSGCAAPPSPPAAERPAAPTAVREAFETERSLEDNLDSVAVWHGGDGRAWLIATAKETHHLKVYDAATGRLLQTLGEEGEAPGQFRRPNGVAVVDDLLLVCERDNRRVQVLHLPDLRPLATVGSERLRRPYGLTVFGAAAGGYELYVSDNYGTEDDAVPAPAELGERIQHYRLALAGGELEPSWVRAFGATAGAGMLHVVESIMADPLYDRLLIADEHPAHNDVKVYTLDGQFTGTIVGAGLFAHQPEGIALHGCGAEGFWITTDQTPGLTRFLIFDRRRLGLLGSFTGATTHHTDGIASTPAAFGPFAVGALFAVHADQSVTGFPWQQIRAALALPHCAAP